MNGVEAKYNPVPSPMGPLQAELNKAHENVMIGQDMLNKLRDRLSPVIRPDEPRARPDSEYPPASPVVLDLLRLNERIIMSNHIIDDLINRLEL